MTELRPDRLADLLERTTATTVAVVGDVMLDRYFWGSVARVSPEAPVPVVDVDDESFHLGGAASQSVVARRYAAAVRRGWRRRHGAHASRCSAAVQP